jgi:hypothetical protein
MYWLVAGLLSLGAIFGATIRIIVFMSILFGAAIVGGVVGAVHGAGASLWDALMALLTLQVGYAIGFVLKVVVGSRRK